MRSISSSMQAKVQCRRAFIYSSTGSVTVIVNRVFSCGESCELESCRHRHHKWTGCCFLIARSHTQTVLLVNSDQFDVGCAENRAAR